MTIFQVSNAQDNILSALSNEMSRQMDVLKGNEMSPYYIQFRVIDTEKTTISASLGGLKEIDILNKRYFQPIYRIGSYKIDNIGVMRGQMATFKQIPLFMKSDDLAGFIRSHCNNVYLNAVKGKASGLMITNTKNPQDTMYHFSEAPISIYYEPESGEKRLDAEKWKNKVREYSNMFSDDIMFTDGTVSISQFIDRHYITTSEGIQVVQNKTGIELNITGYSQAEDGEKVNIFKSYFAHSIYELPSDSTVIKDILYIKQKLKELINSKRGESGTAPVIFSGSAASVFFHEVIGHRVEADEFRIKSSSKAFSAKSGERLLPSWLSLYDDPTIKNYNGIPLTGYYMYDDEGVPGEKVDIFTNGILTGFLTSRLPTSQDHRSNGHARSYPGFLTISRQSNLIVKSDSLISDSELRNSLLTEIKKQGKEYGYYIESVSGGLTNMYTFSINAFNVKPVLAYKVYADKRPDELIHGMSFIGTPMDIMTKIIAIGGNEEVFNGYCGSTSGWIPVSAVSPSILISSIELQNSTSPDNKPLLSRP